MQQLTIQHGNLLKEGPEKNAIMNSDQEILELTQEIENLEREVSGNNDRMKKIYLVSDQVGGWANRVMSKLNSQVLGQDI